jgi:hypothetical protein
MKRLVGWIGLIIIAWQAAACGVSPIQITAHDPALSTALAAYTQTAKFVNSPTVTITRRFSPTPKRTFTPTLSPTLTLSPTPSVTDTPLPVVKLNVMIVTCDTGVDIFHNLGEVTNAYVVVQNVGTADASNVEATLKGSDEQKPHPNKSYLVQNLPVGYEIPLKLTVDTEEGVSTSISVGVTSAETVSAKASKTSCKTLVPEENVINKLGKLFVVREIAKP